MMSCALEETAAKVEQGGEPQGIKAWQTVAKVEQDDDLQGS
jgi:hypothetical protein